MEPNDIEFAVKESVWMILAEKLTSCLAAARLGRFIIRIKGE